MTSDALQRKLLNDEKMLWTGRPQQGFLLSRRDWLLVPFSLVWIGFIVFWETFAISMPHAPVFFKFFGGGFLLIGLYFVIGRFFVDAWLRTRIRYAVTNKRILIERAPPMGKLVAIQLDRLPTTSLAEAGAGRGTILFGEAAPFWRANRLSLWTPTLDPTPQFIAIEDATTVFAQIQNLTAHRS